jgi:hypothetical protein
MPVMKSLSDELFGWKTTLSFLSLATLIILLMGWIMMNDAVPLMLVIDFSESQTKFIRFWLGAALVIGVIVPSIAFFVWRSDRQSRKVLGFYLLVLIVQIVTEEVLSTVLFPSIVVVVGTIYTAFRLWQLWQGQQLIATTTQLGTVSRWKLRGLLWLLLIYWFSNIIMLLVFAWPIVLQNL